MISLLDFLSIAGTAAFAASGALLAAKHRLDIIGFIFIGNITGIGGGTFRDLILDTPVFWLVEWRYVVICSVAAIITYFATRQISKGSKALLWADAIGMALFSVLGAQKAILLGMSVPVAAIMGMFSACLGGIIRDMILKDASIIFSREIYITASLTGSVTYSIMASYTDIPASVTILSGCIAAFTVRALAISRNLSLPSHQGTD